MITYAIKVEEKMRDTHPDFHKAFDCHYYYMGKDGWMAGQPLYEGYKTLRGAKVGLAAYKKQHDYYIGQSSYKNGFWTETIIGIVPMNGIEEASVEED